MKEGKFNLDKILIASGFVGGIIFFATIYFLLPLFYPEFDPVNQTISELGDSHSPVRIFANVFGFSMFGVLIMLFAVGIFRSDEINMLGKTGAVFFLLAGAMMYLVGIFYSKSNFSTMATLHNIVANYQFPILAMGLVLFALSIALNKKLRWLTPVILILGIATLILAYVFFFTNDLQNRGIWQRFAIGIPYIIVMIISVVLYKERN
ncbi:MAG: DUF998 domain-containing protein [Candidatus Aenigmarchaeota archaeon]|nr:DUF998 domain-containing protein [Candidatus Aenigmarchaeota archaeon]